MQAVTTDKTIQVTQTLKVLYAEDDVALQTQTKEFLDVLFASVTVVSNGVEALKEYQKEYFDIVISDIKMPHMDGVELSQKIKEINPHQCIIITSAYNDSNYLLTFINLHINEFILKPINVNNMLQTLYYTSKAIMNEKMVEGYREDLEKSNKELTQKNEELNSLVRILDAKLVQIGKHVDISDADVSIDVATIDEKDLIELKEIEIDIGGAAVLITLAKNIDIENIRVLSSMFLAYATILKNYTTYTKLSQHIIHMSETLHNIPESFIKKVDEISILLESFIYVLRIWRNYLAHKEIRKAMELHSSMINDIETIISIIDGTQEEVDSEMEFF